MFVIIHFAVQDLAELQLDTIETVGTMWKSWKYGLYLVMEAQLVARPQQDDLD